MPRAVYSLSPDAWERPTSYDLHDSTKPNARRVAGKAGNHGHADASLARRASSNYQFFAPGGFVFLFSQLAVGFQNHLKRVFQVFASFIQSLALRVDPRYFLHPGSPPITHLLICSSQLHICIFIAFGLLVQPLSVGGIVQKPLDESSSTRVNDHRCLLTLKFIHRAYSCIPNTVRQVGNLRIVGSDNEQVVQPQRTPSPLVIDPIHTGSHRPSTRPPIHSTSSAAGHSASSGRQVASLDIRIFFQKSLFVIKFFLR